MTSPRRSGVAIALSLLILLAILVAVSALLLSDDDADDETAGEVVAIGAWVRVVPAAGEGALTPVATESMGEGMAMGSGGMTAGAFITLRNATGADVRLVGVSVPSSVARAAELHETTVDENQVMRMRPVQGIDIPRGQEVQLASGGLHIMLLDVQPGVAVGTTVELTLTFADGATLVVPADVREAS